MTGSPIGLVQACDDANLLAFPLWPRQRALLAALETAGRMHIWALGRRSGKTTLMAVAALHNLLFRPDLDGMVRPGEQRYAVCVATSIRQARVLLKAALSIVEASSLLSGMLESVSEDELRFVGGRVLAALPCSSRSTRGWAVSFLALDEYAHFHSDSEGPAAAERVYAALVPATAQFGDAACVIVSSTPAGDGNEFARLFQLAADGELEGTVAHHATTQEVNPTITPAFLASEEKRDPVSFGSEYEARFVGGSGAFFEAELLESCIAGEHELDPSAATGWTAGLDPAMWRDPLAAAVVGFDRDDPARLVLGAVRSWAPPKRKPETAQERRDLQDRVLGEVGDLLVRFGVRSVISDGYLGAQVDEALRPRGFWPERVTLTGPMRLEVFSALRSRLQAGTLRLYRHEGLLAELARVRTSYRGKSLEVLTPRSAAGHFDCAISLALAVWAIDRTGRAGRGTPLVERGNGPAWRPVTSDLLTRVF